MANFGVAEAAGYQVFDIGILAGAYDSQANDISDNETVVGRCSKSLTDNTVAAPFVWTPNGGINFLEGTLGEVNAVSYYADYAGGAIKTKQGMKPVIWNLTTGLIDAYLPGGLQASVKAISIGNVVVGWTAIVVNLQIRYVPCRWHIKSSHNWLMEILNPNIAGYGAGAVEGPVFWLYDSDHGVDATLPIVMSPIQPTLPEQSWLMDLFNESFVQFSEIVTATNAGKYVCGYGKAGGLFNRAFLNSLRDRRWNIPPLPGDQESYAYGLNNILTSSACFVAPRAREELGLASSNLPVRPMPEVIGASKNSTSNHLTAIVWTQTLGSVALPGLSSDGDSCALAINELGRIVGWSVAPDGKKHAVIWRPGQRGASMKRKEPSRDLPPEPGPFAISDWMVTGIFKDGETFYTFLQHPKDYIGIKLLGDSGLQRGDVVTVEGDYEITNGEKVAYPLALYIQARQQTLPGPLGASQRNLLICTQEDRALMACLRTAIWGRVVGSGVDNGNSFVYLDDGTGFVESPGYDYKDELGAIVVVPPTIGIRVYTREVLPEGEWHVFRGVASTRRLGDRLIPIIWAD